MPRPSYAKGAATTEPADGPLEAPADKRPVPGLILIFADGRPAQGIFRAEGGSIELGRLELGGGDSVDSMISRRHALFSFDGAAWQVKDLDSRNGTFVCGSRISGETRAPSGSTVRLGGTLLLPVPDVLPFKHYGLGMADGIVSGPSLRSALETIALTQSVGKLGCLLISGESGTGKEIAASVFHASGPKSSGRLVAVNCATIPKDLAERLLFGSRRGAFSGATDAQGYVQAADGGTLFLDEIAELPLDVQSKLLRMLETREVLRLGATNYERVDVRVCAATWRDLREEVGAERFRQDLYFRIGQPEVRLPALRERIEEVPWHIQHVLDQFGDERLGATATFVEACALRPWPGNVRELRAEVRRAAAVAAARDSKLLTSDDLATTAGRPMSRTQAPASSAQFPDDAFAAALAAESGNVAGAARRLGVHRNKVRRWLERHGVDATRFAPGRRLQSKA